MEIINTILSNPLYSLLFGGGGILVIIISAIAIITQKKKPQNKSGIFVDKSKKTSIIDNDLKNQVINVKDSEDTNAFSKISGIKKIDLSSHISIENSTNVTVSGNQFNQSVTYVFDGFANSIDDHSIDASIRIKFEPARVNDKTERALLNVDYIERFIFECNQQSIIPTIRLYAFFSHLSSIRARSDTTEYNQLVLTEKDLFDKMLYLNFRIKLIISLDIPIILVKWYDNISETIGRITDLSDKVDEVCDKYNIEIVIDEINSLDGQFILHDCLFIHALSADPINKYNITQYEINQYAIRNAIKVFDERFRYLSLANNVVKKHIRTSSMSAFIKKTVDCRLEELNSSLAFNRKV